jgi:hypothetical protein
MIPTLLSTMMRYDYVSTLTSSYLGSEGRLRSKIFRSTLNAFDHSESLCIIFPIEYLLRSLIANKSRLVNLRLILH